VNLMIGIWSFLAKQSNVALESRKQARDDPRCIGSSVRFKAQGHVRCLRSASNCARQPPPSRATWPVEVETGVEYDHLSRRRQPNLPKAAKREIVSPTTPKQMSFAELQQTEFVGVKYHSTDPHQTLDKRHIVVAANTWYKPKRVRERIRRRWTVTDGESFQNMPTC
jgi:hypothetical protein